MDRDDITVPRLIGWAIRTAGQLRLDDVVVFAPHIHEGRIVFPARTERVTRLEVVGDDVVINDNITTSVGNRLMVATGGK